MSNMKKKELEEKVEELASELFKAKNAIVALAERRENQLATIEDLAETEGFSINLAKNIKMYL